MASLLFHRRNRKASKQAWKPILLPKGHGNTNVERVKPSWSQDGAGQTLGVLHTALLTGSGSELPAAPSSYRLRSGPALPYHHLPSIMSSYTLQIISFCAFALDIDSSFSFTVDSGSLCPACTWVHSFQCDPQWDLEDSEREGTISSQ